jgi:hypothetical protein
MPSSESIHDLTHTPSRSFRPSMLSSSPWLSTLKSSKRLKQNWTPLLATTDFQTFPIGPTYPTSRPSKKKSGAGIPSPLMARSYPCQPSSPSNHFLESLAFPHRVSQDDVYEGYFIPKGSVIVCNTWSAPSLRRMITPDSSFRHMTHDPQTYHDPSTFNPDRFIATETHKPEPDPQISFGFGRR